MYKNSDFYFSDIVPLFYTDRTDVDLQPIKDHCITRSVIIGQQTKKQAGVIGPTKRCKDRFYIRDNDTLVIKHRQKEYKVTDFCVNPNTGEIESKDDRFANIFDNKADMLLLT